MLVVPTTKTSLPSHRTKWAPTAAKNEQYRNF